jgi:hypothetical protein
MRKAYQKRTFNPSKERHYPERERLYGKMGERTYLDEVVNPFRQIMANEFSERHWSNWDIMLLSRAPESRVDGLMRTEQPRRS